MFLPTADGSVPTLRRHQFRDGFAASLGACQKGKGLDHEPS
ncbi:MAG TPA: hypothetical protein VIM14_04260 [Polyangia bacterium]